MTDSTPTTHWAAVQIAELLASVMAQDTVEDALAAVADGIAETFDAEIVVIVGGGEVRRSLGFGAADVPPVLVEPPTDGLDVAGLGWCEVRSVPLTDPEFDHLVVARTGAPFGEEETALMTGVARTVELALRTVRSLARERELRAAAAENAQRQAQLVTELQYRGAFDETLLAVAQTLLTGDPARTESAVAAALERLATFLGLDQARIEFADGETWVAVEETPGGSGGSDASDATVVGVPLASRSHPDARLVVRTPHADRLDDDGRALCDVAADLIANALDRRATHVALEAANRELRRSNVDLERANRELRAANAMKDDFVSMTSHELRTPLTAIQGFAETVMAHGEHITPQMNRELARRIHSQSTRLGRLVGDILDISRLESDDVGISARPVAVRQLVTDILADTWGSEDGLVTDLGEQEVLVDPDHLRRILLNYVENAQKYGAPPVRVESKNDGDSVVIRVTDHGDGVPRSFEPKLFDKFQQASRGTRRSSTGTGLGLAIVRRLARLNGGVVGYERGAAGGACFWVRLPAVTARERSGGARRESAGSAPRPPRS